MRLRHRDGPLTRELVREPGGFGLGQVPSRLKPDAVASLVCGFCSTGCSLDVHLRDDGPVNITPSVRYPVNQGQACPKGWEALAPLAASDRAVTPLWRDRRGRLQPISWPVASVHFVERFRALLDRHGPDSVAFLSTGQIPTEEMALLGALAKFGMGMVHGDGNTRQCMATTAAAYKESFGFDAPPYTYADFEESDVIVLVGSNLCIAHPIMWERIRANRHDPEVVVVDPRKTETAMAATRHLAIHPKSDLTLMYGLAHLLVRNGWVDREFVDTYTSGFEELAAHVEAFPPERVSAVSGISTADLEDLAALIHGGERVSFWWTMGVNQSHEGTRTAQAIINLALLTGNIGRPGTGANSITGQCNAMGSRLFSNTTNLFGGRDFSSGADRNDVAAILGIDAGRIPTRPSWSYDRIIDAAADGTLRGLWVVATNSAHSWIDQSRLREAMSRLDFLVVQDMYATTETAELADLVLPAAGWGEKDGTFINSERRIGRIRPVARPPGAAIPDFDIFRLLADAWGCGDLFRAWTTPEEVFRLLARLSQGRPCDIGGITGYDMIDRAGGIQWPLPAGTDAVPAEERRLFSDGRFFHRDGRARLVVGDPTPVAEPVSAEFPLVLLTGRASSSQWHTQTRTAKSAVLRAMSPADPYVEMAPADASARSLVTGDTTLVRSRRGSMRARVVVTPTIREGQVFVPMHYGATNRLTHASFDPHSRQPAYKSAAVQVGPATRRER
ncbi:MAG TPA: nitrate reductase [Acidimicrobiales bacterium]|nr:nitrate reductase [Acidimicrobiales bacterium]